jgi:putative membrane-bound dehydrogenase-like protein
MFRHLGLLAVLCSAPAAAAADGNRLAHLEEWNPYYPHRDFPRLVTPQWVGEAGVEAVVILAIDDLRQEPGQWEKFLWPIIQHLKQFTGQAPISIMSCRIPPDHPHWQKWLHEGLSLEVHTLDHPCPFFRPGFAKARHTYEGGVDLMCQVPGNRPVAFRMPCCDSLNTPSPRFYAELFARTTPQGHFLQIDSSVFQVFTPWDATLPRSLVLDEGGHERFPSYLPADRAFINTIEDYPYPYVIGGCCWEFPCMTPSDWQAQHRHGPAHPQTLRDWQAALDAVVHKQGVFTMVFHPYGWSSPQQHLALIDYAHKKYGRRVRFLTFREALERLNRHLLAGQPLRKPQNGERNDVYLLDLNQDGYLDVVLRRGDNLEARVWLPGSHSWQVFSCRCTARGVLRWGVLDHGQPLLLQSDGQQGEAWRFDQDKGWVREDRLLSRWAQLLGEPVKTEKLCLRDVDGDGRCEVLAQTKQGVVVLGLSADGQDWQRLPFTLPPGAPLWPQLDYDTGLRLIDLDGDGKLDVLWSNEESYGLYLFQDRVRGWGRKVLAGSAKDKEALPPLARQGHNEGCWLHSGHLWWANEHTVALKDHVARRSLEELLRDVQPEPRSPQESLRALRPRPGFVAELMVAEPLVQSPIAFAWGPDGKLWVVEMDDYPLGADGKGKPSGRIKYLWSSRNDGRYDRACVFLDGLSFPTGVLPWRRGILVTCAPDIFYAEDRDGDGKADYKEVLYTGFVPGNPQHRVNSLVWGLDNWIYCANGDSGGVIRSLKTGKTVNIRGRDLRIRPDTGELDTATGQTQYGRSRDDWGNWFGGNNSDPVRHYVLEDHYLRRNPHYAGPPPRIQISVTPGAARVYPLSRTLPRFNDPGAANHFTSANSPVVYRDELFGPFAASVFVSEPVHNLVHREVLERKGVTFVSRRAPDEAHSEFLASRDNWFRPTMLQTGPDGCLWLADMYRLVIEHPEWIPLAWQRKLDLRAGHDRGRIYRIYPEDKKPRPIPRLDRLDAAGLVAALDSPNGWQRDLAQMMLLWRADAQAIPLLEEMACRATRPQTRLQALCTLDGLLPAEKGVPASFRGVLRQALADPHWGVRKQAIRIAEARLKQAPELGAALLPLVNDPDPQVRLQLAYTLGEWSDPRAAAALGQLAVQEVDDPYLISAIFSSVNAENLEGVLHGILQHSGGRPPASLLAILLRLAEAFDRRNALAALLTAVARPGPEGYASWQYAALAELLEALAQRGSSLAQLQKDPALRRAVEALQPLLTSARQLVETPTAPLSLRRAAVRLLGRGGDQPQEDLQRLSRLLRPQAPAELQEEAVATLGRLRNPEVPALLLREWKSYSPRLRTQVLEVLLSRPAWTQTLLTALEEKQVLPQDLDAVRRQRLLEHKDARLRRRAAQLLAGSVSPDRQKVLEAYRQVLTLPGDPQRGRGLFQKHCATCHRLAGVGNAVGPDLASLSDRSNQALLVAVLDPNRAVEARYLNYQATTRDGRVYTGVLASETGNSITLVGPDGKTQVIPRAELEELVSTGKSAMPEGLEKDLQPQDLADLFEYLRQAVRASAPDRTSPAAASNSKR